MVNHDVAQRVAAFFSAAPRGAAAVYVFGSVARGEARQESDVDVGVLFVTAPPRSFASQPYALEGELERALARAVDLVSLDDAPVDLRIRVVRDGQLVFEADRRARIAFEVRTRNEAWDLEPILRRYRAPRRAAG